LLVREKVYYLKRKITDCPIKVRVLTLRNSSRKKNVDRIARELNCDVDVFYGYTADQERTKTFLNDSGIFISPKYWQGGGTIHAGKIGLWVSFLSFIKSLNGEIGIFIENDSLITSDDFRRLLNETPRSLVTTYDRDGNGVDIIDSSKGKMLWSQLRIHGIINPLDITLRQWSLVTKGSFYINKRKTESSEILSSKKLNITEYNSNIPYK